jgi:hypothetical protein
MRNLMRAGLASGALLLAFAGQAQAVTKIGSDLSAPAEASLPCGGSDCTVVQRTLPGRQLTAPIDGVIVRWQIKVGAGSQAQPVVLRVVRGAGATSTGVGSSEPENVPAAPGVYLFDTRLSIRAGDRIGIDCCNPVGYFFSNTPGSERDIWLPRLNDGETRAPLGDGPLGEVGELLVNADIEPDADRDGYGDESQDRCPTDATAQGWCPTVCQGEMAGTIYGTEGDDTLLGTAGRDAIFGLGGDDVLDGGDGADCLDGVFDDDIVKGGADSDRVVGYSGNDALRGQGGKDFLKGGDGRDRLTGGAGEDKLRGTGDRDKLRGGAGKDVFKGDDGADKLDAVDGERDRVSCGAGDDKATVDPVDKVSQSCETVVG